MEQLKQWLEDQIKKTNELPSSTLDLMYYKGKIVAYEEMLKEINMLNKEDYKERVDKVLEILQVDEDILRPRLFLEREVIKILKGE